MSTEQVPCCMSCTAAAGCCHFRSSPVKKRRLLLKLMPCYIQYTHSPILAGLLAAVLPLFYIQGGPKNLAPFFLYALTLPNNTDFQNYFIVRIRRKFVIILGFIIIG